MVKLNHVTVGATDMQRAQRFYESLGLRLIVRTDSYLRFECPEDGSTYSVDRVAVVPANEQVTIYFETPDLDAEYQRLSGAGIVFDQAPQTMPWLWREARLRDPDGHRLCLFHAGEARQHPPWRLS